MDYQRLSRGGRLGVGSVLYLPYGQHITNYLQVTQDSCLASTVIWYYSYNNNNYNYYLKDVTSATSVIILLLISHART